jgi:hypothetical protein
MARTDVKSVIAVARANERLSSFPKGIDLRPE